MAVVPLTVFTMPPRWPTLPIGAGSLTIGAGQSMTVAGDGVSFPMTGNELILIKGGAAGHVLTIASRPDQFNRPGDITYSVGIGIYAVLPQILPAGYAAATGLCTITSDAGGTDILFWCLKLQP